MERPKVQRGKLVKDLGNLLKSQEFTDFTLLIGSRQFSVHRAVLAARSLVFTAMLHHRMREADSGCVNIRDMEEDVLEELLCYLYTDRTPHLGKLAEKLLVAADKYDLPFLKRRCEEKMAAWIDKDSAAALAVFAWTYSCTLLKNCVLKYIAAREDDVLASDGWAEAQKSSPQIIAEVCNILVAAKAGSELSITERPNHQRANVVCDMRELLKSQEFSDFTLLVGSRQFRVHRAVLAARSAVFAAMLRPGMREADIGYVNIPDMEEDVLEKLLHYMYTDLTPCLGHLTEKLLIAADKYDLPLLKRRCEDMMFDRIDEDSAAALAIFAWTYSCTPLKSYVLKYIATNEDDVLASDGWAEAQKSSPQIIAEVCYILAAAKAGSKSVPKMAYPWDLDSSLIDKAQYGTLEEVQSLVAAGADLGTRTHWRQTLLHVAAKKGRPEVVAYLLEEGAYVDEWDTEGFTPLHLAATEGNLGTVEVLLQAGADCDGPLEGVGPLRCAAHYVDIVRALLAAGATVNGRHTCLQTPLHTAVKCNKPEVAAVLLAAGADRGAKNREQKTPLELVEWKEKRKWEQILREHP